MKLVVIVADYSTLSFMVYGFFRSAKAACEWADNYFQDDPDFRITDYDPELHEDLLEQVERRG